MASRNPERRATTKGAQYSKEQIISPVKLAGLTGGELCRQRGDHRADQTTGRGTAPIRSASRVQDTTTMTNEPNLWFTKN